MAGAEASGLGLFCGCGTCSDEAFPIYISDQERRIRVSRCGCAADFSLVIVAVSLYPSSPFLFISPISLHSPATENARISDRVHYYVFFLPVVFAEQAFRRTVYPCPNHFTLSIPCSLVQSCIASTSLLSFRSSLYPRCQLLYHHFLLLNVTRHSRRNHFKIAISTYMMGK